MAIVVAEPETFADLALSRRLEKAEGESCARFAETHARLTPQSGAAWIKVAGAYTVFDGVNSPVTQTFGLGLFQPATHGDMETIERFFVDRGAPVYHEISPLADGSLWPLLGERGYQPFEFTSVLFRSTQGGLALKKPRNDRVQVRLIREDEHELWAQTSARGWSEHTEFADAMLGFGRIGACKSDNWAFIAELDGKPIATGAMSICEKVAHLAGASTIPEGRRQGAQLALLESRLRHAAEHGCDIATMGALPGSASQRNAERQGFRIAYTRIKWRLPNASK
jgi:hypothetical protein